MEKPVVRLHLFFARDVPKAVILRQGPTEVFRLILWDRRDDTFEDGQWTKQRVYVDRCALAPDATHFLYFMLDGQWHRESEGAYTALSRPPYWTALSLFPEGSTWGGGGGFFDATHYWADGDADIIGRDEGMVRVLRTEVSEMYPHGLKLVDGKPYAPPDSPGPTRDPFLERTPPPSDHPLDRYDTMGGKLYRRVGAELELIRDFTDMSFEPIRAPYDWRDDDGAAPPKPRAPWHPLDGEDG